MKILLVVIMGFAASAESAWLLVDNVSQVGANMTVAFQKDICEEYPADQTLTIFDERGRKISRIKTLIQGKGQPSLGAFIIEGKLRAGSNVRAEPDPGTAPEKRPKKISQTFCIRDSECDVYVEEGGTEPIALNKKCSQFHSRQLKPHTNGLTGNFWASCQGLPANCTAVRGK